MARLRQRFDVYVFYESTPNTVATLADAWSTYTMLPPEGEFDKTAGRAIWRGPVRAGRAIWRGPVRAGRAIWRGAETAGRAIRR